jgi:hypothetical protein
MKNLILPFTFLMILIGNTSSAQTEPDSIKYNDIERLELSKDKDGLHVKVQTIDSITGEVKDTTKIKMKNSTIYIVSEGYSDEEEDTEQEDKNRRNELTYWDGVELGINGFLNPDGGTELDQSIDFMDVDYAQSRSLSINFWEQKIRLIHDYVGITTGAGLQWNNYRLKNDYTLSSTKDTVEAFLDDTISMRKNKLRTTWLTVPLLLEFNTSKEQDKNFHLSAGVIGGLRLGTMYKRRFDSDGESFRAKTKNNFNIAPYRLEAAVRVGYGAFNLFATYQLTELFEDENGPELYPFTVGITLFAFN